MPEDTFAEVIAVEKEIKDGISAERRRVDQWLENVKKEIASEYRREIKSLKQEMLRLREEKISETEERIGQTVQEAKQTARRLEGIDDDTLRPLLEEILQRLVPEKGS